MFVPRAVRLKGVKEAQRPKAAKPSTNQQASKDATTTNSKDALVQAMGMTSMNSPAPQQDTASHTAAPTRGPRFITRPVTPEYMAQLATGIELIFTDYAHQEESRANWLKERYREVDGEQNYIHLTAILSHSYISKLKPEATQILLQQALHDHPSKLLELSHNGYHVRRRPSTYPAPFVPAHSFDMTDDDGLAFWDQRTIYVEPHLRNMCPQPAQVAQWLADHGALKPKWLPVQAVHTLWNSCAFVVLSGSVMHEGTWNKWRETGKPEDWKIMTKVEHTKRTAEYRALLERENLRGMRRAGEDVTALPQIARPAALPVASRPLAEVESGRGEEAGGGKRKRKRRKAGRSTAGATGNDDMETEARSAFNDNQGGLHEPDTAMVDADAPEHVNKQPDGDTQQAQASKRKRKKWKSDKPNAAAEHIGLADMAPAAGTVDAAQPSKKRRC
ncbi:hypothetical protein G6514_008912 [Epicoccum nigrum]|nr:hypothetical protein G6514_008912 [Epicoccum nigrum]